MPVSDLLNPMGKKPLLNWMKMATKKFKLAKDESLSKTHSAIHDLTLDALNKSTAVLSNGIELKIGGSINPYSYDQTLADNMMLKAVKEHFKLEKEYLTKTTYKASTLFFIDDIEGVSWW